MKMLSHQSWTCKCGHIEKGETAEERKTKAEAEEGNKTEEARVRFWETKKRVRKKTSPHGRMGFGDKKKRTSTRG